MKLTIPTILTFFRILLIPVFVLCFTWNLEHQRLICTLIFTLAAVTDWLDGFLARSLNQTSRFGAFLDPVADKLMVSTALVLLVMENPHIWFAVATAIIIGREISISALREWMAEIGKHSTVKVKWLGKVKTFVQMLAIILLIYRGPVPYSPVDALVLGEFALFVAAVLTLWSMVLYIKSAWPYLKE